MKTCLKCWLSKSPTEFYANKYSKDRLHSYCKDCLKAYVKTNPHAQTRAQLRSKAASGIDKLRKADRIYQHRRRALNPAWKSEQSRLYALNNPDRTKAYGILHYQLKKGNVSRAPCEICRNPRAQAHHPDYAKPFQVKWLCASHHKLEHLALVDNV